MTMAMIRTMRIIKERKRECYGCLICGRNCKSDLHNINIGRLCHDSNVISFSCCSDCLKQMVDDINYIIEGD